MSQRQSHWQACIQNPSDDLQDHCRACWSEKRDLSCFSFFQKLTMIWNVNVDHQVADCLPLRALKEQLTVEVVRPFYLKRNQSKKTHKKGKIPWQDRALDIGDTLKIFVSHKKAATLKDRFPVRLLWSDLGNQTMTLTTSAAQDETRRRRNSSRRILLELRWRLCL